MAAAQNVPPVVISTSRAIAGRSTMPRPHIEFLHAQQMPWLTPPFDGFAWHNVVAKILSRDSASGACSALVRWPAGFSCGVHAFSAAQEFFILEGALSIGAIHYGIDDYAYLPRHYVRASLTSVRGAVALVFFDAEPALVSASIDWDHDALLERIDTHRAEWTRHDIDPAVQFLNLAHKVLRHVPASGEKTLLLQSGAQTHPRDWREAQLKHDCVEEMYLLGGDLIGERGVMYEGAYFWRPPGVWHGPFGSRRGSLSLIRFCEGRHQNIWSDDSREFHLEPGHNPQLPGDLPAATRAPWQPSRY